MARNKSVCRIAISLFGKDAYLYFAFLIMASFRGIRLLLLRMTRYEFWPFWLFYFPMYFYGILLEPIGNHNRGTIFRDANHLKNKRLLKLISGIAGSIEGFDYGRFDLKTESLESLYSGKSIKIVEMNGVNSEPAHIYDPGYGLLRAYRDIAGHMRIIYRISIMNHKNGILYASFRRFSFDLKKHLFPG